MHALPKRVAVEFAPQVIPIRQRLITAWSDWKNLREQLSSSEHPTNQSNAQPSALEARGVIGADQKLEVIFAQTFGETQVLMTSAIGSADKVKEEKEKAYESWTYASWVLFGLAWTLGVVGRLGGVGSALEAG
jgi:hypothetical protein